MQRKITRFKGRIGPKCEKAHPPSTPLLHDSCSEKERGDEEEVRQARVEKTMLLMPPSIIVHTKAKEGGVQSPSPSKGDAENQHTQQEHDTRQKLQENRMDN